MPTPAQSSRDRSTDHGCTELGSPGESPCCSMIALLMLEPFPASMGAVQSGGRRNATDTHLLDVFAHAIGRSGPPAVGAPNCAGRAAALAFARGGADVLISYLGSEEVDAEETVR